MTAMNSFTKVCLLLNVFLFTGCTTGSLGASLPPLPNPETVSSAEIRHIGRVASWKITPTVQSRSYSSLLTTVITQTDAPTSRRDSLAIQTLYSISITRSSDAIIFSGSIEAFTVHGNSTASEVTDFVTPTTFTGKLNDHTISSRIFNADRLQNNGDCENAAQTSLKIIQRNIFALPLEITAGQAWTDSTSSTLCSGALRITSTVVRTLTVIEESELEGIPVLVLDDSERTFSKGEGSQEQHRIVVESRGLTNGHLYVNLSSGQLLTANTTNKTSVSIESSGRVQHFMQNSTEVTQTTR
jgi:hypothetical protein